MQQIERYGVMALLFLMITVVAVVLWGEDAPARFVERPRSAVAQDRPTTAPAERGGARSLPPAVRRPERSAPERDARQVPGDHVAHVVARPQPTTEQRAAEQREAQRREAERRAAQQRESDRIAAETRAAEKRAAERRAAEQRAAEKREAEKREADQRAARLAAAVERPAKKTKKPEPGAATYTVRPGDSLGKIAQRTLGSSKRWKELQVANGITNPNQIRVGQVLKLPRDARSIRTLERPSTPARDHREYLVRRGDVLGTIAQRELGTSKRWKEIVALNPGLKPERLVVGKKILLPAERESDALAAAVERPRRGVQ